jgi:hypothetical protein
LTEKASKLLINSPIAGIVATPNLQNLQGAYLDEGEPAVEVIDDSKLVARVYVPDFAMQNIRAGFPVRLEVRSRLLPFSGVLQSISADWVPLDPALSHKEQLAGINPPRFYTGQVSLDRAVDLRPGTTGIAKIQVGRRSLAGISWKFLRELVARRVW